MFGPTSFSMQRRNLAPFTVMSISSEFQIGTGSSNMGEEGSCRLLPPLSIR
jgi:hypothetical protein